MWDESASTRRSGGFARIVSGGSGIPNNSGAVTLDITSARCTGSGSSTRPPPGGCHRVSGPRFRPTGAGSDDSSAAPAGEERVCLPFGVRRLNPTCFPFQIKTLYQIAIKWWHRLSSLCRRRLKPAATENSLLSATQYYMTQPPGPVRCLPPPAGPAASGAPAPPGAATPPATPPPLDKFWGQEV